MSDSVYKQAFSADFRGINAEGSAIEPDSDDVARAVNYEWAPGNSLRGRIGSQIASPPMRFFGIHRHTYPRTTDRYKERYATPAGGTPYTTPCQASTHYGPDGATISELIGLNQRMWRLDSYTVPITIVNAETYSWYTTVAGAGIVFKMFKGSSEILNFSCGNGNANPLNIVTYYTLLNAIDALADLAITISRNTAFPVAVVNGDQTTAYQAQGTYGGIYRITVDAGHTFYPGDYISGFDFGATELKWGGGLVCAVAAGTIDYFGDQWVLKDNQVLGYLAQPAAMFPITVAQSSSTSPFNLTLPYWRCVPVPVPCSNAGAPGGTQIFSWNMNNTYNDAAEFETHPPSFVSLNGNCYHTVSRSTLWRGLLKYDGQSLQAAGMRIPVYTTAAAAGATPGAGTYKYKVLYRHIDANGNIVEGPIKSSEITLAAGPNGSVLLTYTPPLYSAMAPHCKFSAYANGAGVGVTTGPFTIDDGAAGPAFLHVGDYACMNDTAGALVRFYITEVDNQGALTQIKTTNTAAYNYADNTPISAGLTCVIYRTAAGGNTYYLVTEQAMHCFAAQTYTDTMTDAALVAQAQLVEPEIGKEHDPPPYCGLVAEHQGGLVLARNAYAPNTVYFSSADGPEYFPTASNSFDVPSTQDGPITCLFSDNYDRLAVFKARAYYDVVGVLDDGIFTVNVRNEGDYGIPSPTGIARINSVGLGVSQLGLIVVSNGEIDPQKCRPVNARMIGQRWRFNWARVHNFPGGRQAMVMIPSVITAATVPYAMTAQTFVVDYSRPNISFMERSYDSTVADSGGYTSDGETLYRLTRDICNPTTYVTTGVVFRSLYRFSGDSPNGAGSDGDSYIDNTKAISYILESAPINFGEPSQLKVPVRLRVYSIPNDNIAEGWVAWNAVVDTGIFPSASYIGSGNPGGASNTIIFGGPDEWYKDIKLLGARAFVLLVRFTTNTVGKAPFLTGWEVLFKDAYDKDDLVKP